jgi:hypothetical protein
MISRAFLLLGGLALAAFEAGAGEPMDAACRERLTRQVATLESAFTANRTQFDGQIDQLLTRYAATHPAASRADYQAVFDQMFEQRFSKLFAHHGVLTVYKSALDGSADSAAACKVPERRMNKEGAKAISQDKALYEQIVREMTKVFP